MRRTTYDIVADILEFIVTGGEARISHISRYANLPLDRAKKLAELMVKAGLLRKVNYGDHQAYRATEKSHTYLAHYRELKKLTAPLRTTKT